jgi:hypothetical protein
MLASVSVGTSGNSVFAWVEVWVGRIVGVGDGSCTRRQAPNTRPDRMMSASNRRILAEFNGKLLSVVPAG